MKENVKVESCIMYRRNQIMWGYSMSTEHKFGGNWTIEKLGILSNYLDFYINALNKQPFRKIYIDAFAGIGKISIGDKMEVIEGSAKLALNTAHKFDEYIFIEKKKTFINELKQLVANEYSNISDRIKIKNDESNHAILQICNSIDWKRNRAVLFLDPYATEVEWDTLKVIAATKAIDVWYLFPISAAIRMLKKDKQIDPAWVKKLNTIFGDNGWEEEFYKVNPQLNLFETEGYIKDANTEEIKRYICKRLETVFANVSPNPRILYNSKNSPLFLFCFAVSNDNPRAFELAMRGANHILK